MNLKDVKHIVYLDIFIIAFTIICLVFSLIVILSDNVSARTIEADITNSLSIPTSYSACTQSNGYFWGDDGNSGTACKNHRVKTTINGVLYSLEMVLKNAWLTNQMAFVNITAMSNDFRNNNLYCTLTNSSNVSVPCNVTFNSKSSLVVSFVPNITGNYTLGIYSSTNSAITGIDTYGIRKVIVTQNQGDNSDVIDNANENTQNIIENANQNSEDVINSLNQQTQDIINNQSENSLSQLQAERKAANSSCKNYYDITLSYGKKILSNQGVLTDSNNYSYYTEQYVNIDIINSSYGDRLGIKNPNQAVSGYRFILYDSSFNFISTTNLANRNVIIPSNAQYFRFASPVSNTYIFRGGNCVTSEDETNNYLKDNSDPTVNDNGITNALESVKIDDPLNYLLTLPIHAIERINYQLGRNTCSPINLGAFLGTDLILPCVNVEQSIGTTLFNTMDILIAIGIGAVTLKKFYDSVSNVLTLGKEKEVREKLELPTPMEFFAMIFGGGR